MLHLTCTVEHVAYSADSRNGRGDGGLRFHHRLVWIHPFPNGNGRHARLATDLLLAYNGQPIFTWGSVSLVADSTTRQEYLSSLREADGGGFGRLLQFIRS